MVAKLHGMNDFSRTAPASSELTSSAGSNSQPASSASDIGFGNVFKDAIGQVDQLEDQAHAAIEGLMRGSGIDVHQAMIAAEKASMAFDFALAVRNKAIQSYQNIMSMQF